MSLDPINTGVVKDDFVKINRDFNITVIINIHHVDLALKYAKRVIGINAGVIVFDGPADEVDEKILHQVYGRQLSDDELFGTA